MNYIKIMSKIIKNAIDERGQPENYSKGRKKYSRSGLHLHHIIPVSMGGNNDGANIVILTPREHFLVHWMLHRVYGGKMTVAFRMMIDGKYTAHKRPSAKVYSKLVERSMEERFSDNSWRKKNAESVRKTVQSEKWIESNKITIQKIHNDPEIRARHAESIKRRSEDPHWQAMHAEHLKRMHSSEEYKENHRKAMERLRSCPKFKAGAQERAKKLATNEQWKESCRKAWVAKCKPTIGENIKDGSIICVIGDKDAAQIGFSGSKISCVAKGKRPTHKGHTWRYATYEEVEKYRPGHEWLELNKPA